jgi:hypothetical protein
MPSSDYLLQGSSRRYLTPELTHTKRSHSIYTAKINDEKLASRALRLNELSGRPPCEDGRVVAADVVRVMKMRTEGRAPSVTEHFVKLIVSAKSSKIQRQFQ